MWSTTFAGFARPILTHSEGRTVRIKDVAAVAEAAQPEAGDATIDGQSGVMLQVSAQYGANTVKVT